MLRSRMRLTVRATTSRAMLPLLLTVSACGGSGGYPPLADLQAVTEAKPVPPDEIVTSAAASEHYNAAVESWGDRISDAGLRLCRFFERTGMAVSCPDHPKQETAMK